MKNKILDTLHPVIGLISVGFAILFCIGLCIVVFITSPYDPNKYLLVLGFIVIISILVYSTYRQRAIDFEGKEFYLEDAFHKGITIDASQFEKIEGIISNIYRIKFIDGRSYLFTLNPYTKQALKDHFSWETDPYERRLTKRVREAIEQSKQANDVHQG